LRASNANSVAAANSSSHADLDLFNAALEKQEKELRQADSGSAHVSIDSGSDADEQPGTGSASFTQQLNFVSLGEDEEFPDV
jgi:hypothetical protein